MSARAAIEWGQAGLAMPGETRSGDRCVIDVADDTAMIAVIDGVGHGQEAETAASTAAEVLAAAPRDSLRTLFDRCHDRLRTTRGVAMTVVRFDVQDLSVAWFGAGNIKTILLSRSARGLTCVDLLTYSGVVGARLPNAQPSKTTVARGDVLVLATDGIDKRFIEALRYDEEPQAQAERLLADYRSPADDALVLVARLGR